MVVQSVDGNSQNIFIKTPNQCVVPERSQSKYQILGNMEDWMEDINRQLSTVLVM